MKKIFNKGETMKKFLTKALMLAVVFGFASLGAIAKEYKDLQPGHWAYKQIQILTDFNVVVGYPDGLYRPEQAVTRGEFASIVVKAFDGDGITESNGGFSGFHCGAQNLADFGGLGVVSGSCQGSGAGVGGFQLKLIKRNRGYCVGGGCCSQSGHGQQGKQDQYRKTQ